MARTLLVAGTASHVGKSTVAAGLCRLLADRDVAVAPFKAQNMSNNARVVPRAPAARRDGRRTKRTDDPSPADEIDRWGEIGVSQFVQSRAAEITPTTDVNPVLLKPRGDGESQLIVDGRAVGHLSAGDYYSSHWERARASAEAAYRRLAADHDVVVAEGAGSIAEINLHDRDLANVETARFADAEILLLVDIERGGAFASLYGTVELLPADLRDRVVGAVVTKFRGDASLLEPGIDEIESRTGVSVLGVLPYADPGLPEEDSVALPPEDRRARVGEADDGAVTVSVPRLPRISNATDLEALAAEPGVVVEYVPLDGSLEGADAVVVPGTKNAVDDLLALRDARLGRELAAFSGPVVGVCGGYQLLGERLVNASLEGTGETDVVEGLGLLPVETVFEDRKRLRRTTVPIDGDASPLLSGASGTASGYEIHAGRTRAIDDVTRPLGPTSAARGDVLGTYLHGLFDNAAVRKAFLVAVAERAGREWSPESDGTEPCQSPYDRAASLVANHVDLASLGEPFG